MRGLSDESEIEIGHKVLPSVKEALKKEQRIPNPLQSKPSKKKVFAKRSREQISERKIDKLHVYAGSRRITAQTLHLGGKMHSPDNVEIAKSLPACVETNEVLELPDATCFKVVVRSNSILRKKPA